MERDVIIDEIDEIDDIYEGLIFILISNIRVQLGISELHTWATVCPEIRL